MKSLLLRVVLLVVLSLGATAAPPPVSAANQVVTDCGDSGGANQLRAKINAAQSSGGGHITFTCGPFVNVSSLLPIITINGGNTVTLSGNNATRILYVGGAGTLLLENITLTKGLVTAEDGGAVRNDGTLYVDHAKFIDNHTAAGGSGGAIASYGYVNIIASEFSLNTASNGGALYMKHLYAVADIYSSSFHDNQTQNLSTGWGGAILVFDGADVTLNGSELKNNKAGYGGAVYVYSSQETELELNYTTLSTNLGKNGGGGIYANTVSVQARVDVFYSTLSGNATGPTAAWAAASPTWAAGQ